MFVSAVGVGTFTNSFMETSYADSSSKEGKNGRSTGFSNLEQDTDGDNYNTGYGLHTNKTARAADDTTDGRTFDVDLESWYVGENPVDVATVLDASGSMAWTVDTLDPLEISLTEDVSKELESEYGITSSDLEEFSSYKDETTKLLAAIQKKESGYLPQDVVDLILNPKNTDNSKLSYSDYMYYIYESRSSVSEFVPLGYWDGGQDLSKPIDDANLIGYYPFEEDLKNEKSLSESAIYIKHAEDTENVFGTTAPTQIIEPTFSSGGSDLQISKTAEKGALLADVKATSSFTVSMRVNVDENLNNHNPAVVAKTPLLYIGKGTSNYISLYRGDTDPRRIKVDVAGKKEIINISNFFQNDVLMATKWVNVSLIYDGDLKKVSIKLSTANKAGDKDFESDATSYNLNFDGADIIIGGDVVNENHDLSYTDMVEFPQNVISKCINFPKCQSVAFLRDSE